MFLLEVEDREFGVMLEGIHRLVPQQFLDVVHVGPTSQQLGCATAPECVGRDIDGKPGAPGIGMQQPQEGIVGIAVSLESVESLEDHSECKDYSRDRRTLSEKLQFTA